MADARETAIFAARAYLAEARNRRGQPFAWVLLDWAANARRRAAAERTPTQGSLL